jgi:hypothetical protein
MSKIEELMSMADEYACAHGLTNDHTVQKRRETLRVALEAALKPGDLMVDMVPPATALRPAVRDGRVSIRFVRGIGHYRFHRLTAKGGAA